MWHKNVLLHMILRNLMYLICWDMWQWAFLNESNQTVPVVNATSSDVSCVNFNVKQYFFSEIYVRHKCSVGCYVCTCTNLLELKTEVKNRMYLNSAAMGQINQCWFQSYVVLINNVYLWKYSSFSWVELGERILWWPLSYINHLRANRSEVVFCSKKHRSC